MQKIARTIYCPRCGRRVARYDGRSTINVIANCRNCDKQIIFDIEKWETQIKDIPKRNSSSGMTFR
jgi:transcription elongation factor Elf1